MAGEILQRHRQEDGQTYTIHANRAPATCSDPDSTQGLSSARLPLQSGDITDLSHLDHMLRARTLPYPRTGQNGRNQWVPTTNPEDFRLDNGINSRISPTSWTFHRSKQDPLSDWVHDNNSPWTAIVPSRVEYGSKAGFYPAGQESVDGYVNGHVERYTLAPSDSGYGTRQSMGTTSVFSGDVSELDREGYHQSDVHSADLFLQNYPSPYDNPLPPSKQRMQTGSRTSQKRQGSLLKCPTCKKSVKTPSELKKHQLRHTKPFVCHMSDCDRVTGFSTTNDLERHIKSKHPATLGGKVSLKRWKCPVPKCKSSEKSWPRQDNFRSHLTRLHADYIAREGIERVCSRGEYEHIVNQDIDDLRLHDIPTGNDGRLFPLGSEPGIATDLMEWSRHMPEEPGHMYDYLPTANTVDLVKWKYHQEESLATIGDSNCDPAYTSHAIFKDQEPDIELAVSCKDVSRPEFPIDPRLEAPHVATVFPLKHQGPEDEVASMPTKRQNLGRPATSLLRMSSLESTNQARQELTQELKSSPKGVDALSLIKDLLACKSNILDVISGCDLEALANSNHLDVNSSEKDQAVQVIQILKMFHNKVKECKENKSTISKGVKNKTTCNVCEKFTGRPCELRKHMKRHDRPYFCTFPNCKKRFGSKNDWTRHETSQHLPKGNYRCNSQTEKEGQLCDEIFGGRSDFHTHLRCTHGIVDVDTLKQKSDTCRLDAECPSDFWCGFCEASINIHGRGLEGWTFRANHIDDHFMGRNDQDKQGIRDWVDAATTSTVAHDKSEPPTANTPQKDVVAHVEVAQDEQKVTEKTSKRPPKNTATASQGRKEARRAPSNPISSERKIRMIICCQCPVHARNNPKFDSICYHCSHTLCAECGDVYVSMEN